MSPLRVALGLFTSLSAALCYGYIDLVSPSFTPLAFLSLASLLLFAFRRHALALALLAAFAAAPLLHVDPIFIAAAMALALGIVTAKGDVRGHVEVEDDAEACVRRILMRHAPRKLAHLPGILRKYDGDWNAVLRAAEDKYIYERAAPTPFKSPATTRDREDEPGEASVRFGEPMRQPDFEAVAEVPEEEVEYLYDDFVPSCEPALAADSFPAMAPQVVEAAPATTAPATGKLSLAEARAMAMRESQERKAARIKQLRQGRS